MVFLHWWYLRFSYLVFGSTHQTLILKHTCPYFKTQAKQKCTALGKTSLPQVKCKWMAQTNSSLKMQMLALKMVIKWDCRGIFLDISKKENIHLLLYLLQFNKPLQPLKHHLFAQESIIWAGLSGDNTSLPHEVSIEADRHQGWRTYFQGNLLTQSTLVLHLSQGHSKDMLGILFGTAWAFSKHSGWVPRGSVLRGLGSSYKASGHLVSEVPDYPLCLMLLAK